MCKGPSVNISEWGVDPQVGLGACVPGQTQPPPSQSSPSNRERCQYLAAQQASLATTVYWCSGGPLAALLAPMPLEGGPAGGCTGVQMRAQIEQMENRGSVEPPVSPACSLMGSLPFQGWVPRPVSMVTAALPPGAPQGSTPHGEEVESASEEAEAPGRRRTLLSAL